MLLVRVAAGGCQINARNKHGKLKTVGDHHQQKQDKMEEQQKTEQKEERGRMTEMRAFERVFLVHRKMFLECRENKMDAVVVCTSNKR